jgi:hypothetical protein
MSDQRDDDATPTEDPRGKETSEQNTEESHPGATPPEGGEGPAAARRTTTSAVSVQEELHA